MTATFKIEDFNKYEKVVVQFLAKGKGIFNTTGFKIEFLPDNKITLYYTGSSALASYIMDCEHDIAEGKTISTDYFKFTQILKALAFEGQEEVVFTLVETPTGALIKIDNATTHIDLPAFMVTEEFAKKLSYPEEAVTCSFEEPELYEASRIASSFLTSSEPGASVFVNSFAVSNDDRYVYVAKKKWSKDLEKETSLSKQNLDVYGVLKSIDENASYKHIDSDRTFVHIASENKEFNVQLGEPAPISAPPSSEDLETISTSTVLTEITASHLLSIINFFLSTGIFDGQKWFPLTIQSFPAEKKLKFTVKNTEYISVPALNVERWIDNVTGLETEIEDTISADILKIFLNLLEGSVIIKVYSDANSNGIRFETPEQDLYLAKFS